MSGLRYFYETGRWFEMDVGIGNPVFGSTGFQAPVSVPGEFVYWTAWNTGTPYKGHELWRLDISDENNLVPELFLPTQPALEPREVPGQATGAAVRDLMIDRDGNPVIAWVNTETSVGYQWFDAGTAWNYVHLVLKKYDRRDGSVIWSSADIAQYLISEEMKDPLATEVQWSGNGVSLALSGKYVAVANCARVIRTGPTYTRYVWITLLDVGTGALVAHKRFPGSAATDPLLSFCVNYGIAWSANGHFWIAGTDAWRNDGTTFPRDYRCRLYRINENDFSDTGTVDIEVDSHPRTIPLGISYHHSGTSGRLLIPVWHESEVGGDGEMGVAVYDINSGSVSSSTYGSPYPHFENGPAADHANGGNCGIGRTGQRIGWFEQQLEKGLAPTSAQAPANFWLCDGKRLWKCSLDPLSVDPTAVVSADYEYYSATRRENGDLVYFRPWLNAESPPVLQVKVTVADASDGSEKFSCTLDYTRYAGPWGAWRGTLPYRTYANAYGHHQEMPWAAFAVAAYHG